MEHVDRAKLSAFLDGEVSEVERTKIAAHLKECVSCRGDAEEPVQVVEFLEATEDIAVSPYFLVRLKRKISAERSRSSSLSFAEWVRNFHLERIVAPIGAAALLLVSLLAGTHLGTSIHRERQEEARPTEAEFAEDFGVRAFDDFPRGSLGDAYTVFLSEGGEE